MPKNEDSKKKIKTLRSNIFAKYKFIFQRCVHSVTWLRIRSWRPPVPRPASRTFAHFAGTPTNQILTSKEKN